MKTQPFYRPTGADHTKYGTFSTKLPNPEERLHIEGTVGAAAAKAAHKANTASNTVLKAVTLGWLGGN